MSKPADLIITNARIYTLDPDLRNASAVAVHGNTIVYVGTDEGAGAYRARQTQVIDGQGHTLLPGFIDSHFHLEGGSEYLYGANLRGEQTLTGAADKLRAWAAAHPDAPWVLGRSAGYGLPAPDEPLTRHHLDGIIADRPLLLVAFDYHSMWANTAALRAAGVLHGAPGPLENGEIPLDDEGLAVGALYEAGAMRFIYDALPQPTTEQRLQTLRNGLEHLAPLGITSVHNMDGDLEQARLYGALADRDLLTLRVYMPFSVKPQHSVEDMLAEAGTMQAAFSSELLRGGLVKFFMDGVLESYTGVLLNDYPDRPGFRAEPIWPAERFAEYVTAADAAGFQIATHACGDGAVRMVLDGYETAQRRNAPRTEGTPPRRHRVEHIELIGAEDVPRFAELGVIAAMQPLHAPRDASDPDVWQRRITRDDYDRAFAWRTLREAGATLAFGSDWPVVEANPLLGLHAAVTRRPWAPDALSHRQSLHEAIRGYTVDAAFAEGMETRKGQVRPGMLADLVLLSADIFMLPPEALAEVTVDATVCDGRLVHTV